MENIITNKLRLLTSLQIFHSRLDQIHRLRGSLPDEVRDLEDDIEGLDTRKEKIEEEIANLKQEINIRKGKIEEFQTSIKKYEEQQNNVKNNREFESLAKEIEYAHLEILTSERKIRQLTDQIEGKDEILQATLGKISDKKSELSDKQNELESIIETTRSEEKKYANTIKKLSSEVEERLLKGYTKIRENMRNGLAVVTTDRDACGGCFSLIPPQLHIELKQRQRLIHCENCGRILVDGGIFEEIKENNKSLLE